jgi:hypothetical protein
MYMVTRMKENFLHWFWHKMPKSVLYWAALSAWAKATTTKFSHLHPDDITWSMMQKYLDEESK